MRITSNNITKLGPNEIFVFGSNESGRHGKGAAKTALGFGAIWGKGTGIQGKTYGIPTKDSNVMKTLSLDKIYSHICNFIDYAKDHPELTFLVTEIGCGLAGLKQKEIGPLFREAKDIENIHLPEKFWKYID